MDSRCHMPHIKKHGMKKTSCNCTYENSNHEIDDFEGVRWENKSPPKRYFTAMGITIIIAVIGMLFNVDMAEWYLVFVVYWMVLDILEKA